MGRVLQVAGRQDHCCCHHYLSTESLSTLLKETMRAGNDGKASVEDSKGDPQAWKKKGNKLA